MLTLTKPCVCQNCKQPMAVGDSFKWVTKHANVWSPLPLDRKRPVVNGTTGRTAVTRHVPAHAHDCLTILNNAKQRKAEIENLDLGCDLAKEHESAEWIANYRAERLALIEAKYRT